MIKIKLLKFNNIEDKEEKNNSFIYNVKDFINYAIQRLNLLKNKKLFDFIYFQALKRVFKYILLSISNRYKKVKEAKKSNSKKFFFLLFNCNLI